MDRRMTDLPPPPSSVADVSLAKEVRAHIKRQKSPIDFVIGSMSDPRVLGPVLNAPAFLSGLSDTEWNLVRSRARAALHPAQVEMQGLLTKALDDVREGVAAAQRLLMERCEVRRDDDGQFRSIREPLPGGALRAAG
jgi:hypothetical protein